MGLNKYYAGIKLYLTAYIKQKTPIFMNFHQVYPKNILYELLIPSEIHKLHTQAFLKTIVCPAHLPMPLPTIYYYLMHHRLKRPPNK